MELKKCTYKKWFWAPNKITVYQLCKCLRKVGP